MGVNNLYGGEGASFFIKQILSEEKLTIEGFSKRVGLSLNSIYRLLNDKTSKITLETARKINNAFPKYSLRSIMESQIDNANSQSIASFIRDVFLEENLTAIEFMEKTHISRQTVYKLLSGKCAKITRATAIKINKAFPQYSINDIMEGNKREFNKQKNAKEDLLIAKNDDNNSENSLIDLSQECFLTGGREKIPIDEIADFVICNFSALRKNESFNQLIMYIKNEGRAEERLKTREKRFKKIKREE